VVGTGGSGATDYFVTYMNIAEVNGQAIGAVPGTFKNLYININVAPSGSQTDIFTLRVNGADTAVTCTITGTATSCNDTTHTATITAGQNWSIKVVGSGSAAATLATGGVEFDTQ
jgi:hypothetical protein